MDVDDFILQLADKDTSKKTSKRSRNYVSDSEDDAGFSDEDDMDMVSEEEIDEYGPDLYKDEEDRRRLLAMPEVERERILSERSEERQRYLERLEVRKLLKGGRNRDDSARRSTRAKGTGTSKALTELTRRREEKKTSRSKRHREYSPSPERRSRRRSSYDDFEESDDWASADEEQARAKKRLPSLDELHKAGFTRHMIEQWLYTPFFENTIAGSFVRLYIGTNPKSNNEAVYRLCEVVGIEPWHKMYKISSGVMCNRGIRVKHGKSEKVFPMDIISNSAVTQDEYDRYLKTLDVERVRAPTVEQVDAKSAEISKAKEYVLNDQEVAAMVARKKEVTGASANVAMERAELLARLAHAQAHGDADQVHKVSSRLNELDAINESRQDGNVDNQQRIWEDINRRNRERDKIESTQVEKKLAEERRKALQMAMKKQQQQQEQAGDDAAALTDAPKSDNAMSAIIMVASYEELVRSAAKEIQIELIE
ncbi:hypothetical protein BC940DRAFT_323675 [Gongronella butleri]|nr:hypothetical protein BC940DRAFT_323675 [Gongronella butleri]